MFKLIGAVIKTAIYTILGSIGVYFAWRLFKMLPENGTKLEFLQYLIYPGLVVCGVIAVAAIVLEVFVLVKGMKYTAGKGFFHGFFGLLIIIVAVAGLGIMGVSWYLANTNQPLFFLGDMLKKFMDGIESSLPQKPQLEVIKLII
ncbi:MAG: hypothetical protein LBM99_02305 [Bacillales bacterium]|jgi:hypothetical protein|nr:hypothetical protein [Bacillales bacterium]